MPPVLRAENITKRYPGVLALDDARLEVRPQEIHGLVGENGAGKSTLVNVIAGVVKPDAGQVYLHGEPVHAEHAPRGARRRHPRRLSAPESGAATAGC